MLSTLEIHHRFHMLAQAVGQAAQACSVERQLPAELRSSVQRLDQHADRLGELLDKADGAPLDRLLTEMLVLVERARQVCINVPQVSAHMRSAVHAVQGQLQELQRDLRARQPAS
ncbi:hypothetical protein [Duganella qianjiadongensis]|uniref:DUF1484 family protein n=1 Tax=Duganella qianjiadongensis TaxID=2692176 RepID=A0ABW9VKV1_9BURK|nr:hypothetical protein [Duganella qianjiadongensis]MYM40002.1 hypothetical protein [Duganella qianjiadongensis]